jgi:type IV secretion system protein VirB2
MKVQHDVMFTKNAITTCKALASAVFLVAMLFAGPVLAADEYDATEDKVCGFLGSFTGLLTAASIAVVTIAVVFAGYQIAFAHKRIGDVAPILIGGLLIGAAGQIASMVMPDNTADQCKEKTTMVSYVISSVA